MTKHDKQMNKHLAGSVAADQEKELTPCPVVRDFQKRIFAHLKSWIRLKEKRLNFLFFETDKRHIIVCKLSWNSVTEPDTLFVTKWWTLFVS